MNKMESLKEIFFFFNFFFPLAQTIILHNFGDILYIIVGIYALLKKFLEIKCPALSKSLY